MRRICAELDKAPVEGNPREGPNSIPQRGWSGHSFPRPSVDLVWCRWDTEVAASIAPSLCPQCLFSGGWGQRLVKDNGPS